MEQIVRWMAVGVAMIEAGDGGRHGGRWWRRWWDGRRHMVVVAVEAVARDEAVRAAAVGAAVERAGAVRAASAARRREMVDGPEARLVGECEYAAEAEEGGEDDGEEDGVLLEEVEYGWVWWCGRCSVLGCGRVVLELAESLLAQFIYALGFCGHLDVVILVRLGDVAVCDGGGGGGGCELKVVGDGAWERRRGGFGSRPLHCDAIDGGQSNSVSAVFEVCDLHSARLEDTIARPSSDSLAVIRHVHVVSAEPPCA